MKDAAIGLHMHSGWGVLVAVCLSPSTVEILDRRRIVTADPQIPGSNQPYHHASRLEAAESEKYLATCTAASISMAASAIEGLVKELDRHRIVGCAILLASGRPLPPLAKILASHPLIHTAEGEFFRQTIRRACEVLQIPAAAIRERELDVRAGTAFGAGANRLQQRISNLGKSIGPPWTADHKTAALAAAIILAGTRTDEKRGPIS
jgi:hypothetical protein